MTGSHEVRGSIPLGSTNIEQFTEGLAIQREALGCLARLHLNRKLARCIEPSFNSTTS